MGSSPSPWLARSPGSSCNSPRRAGGGPLPHLRAPHGRRAAGADLVARWARQVGAGHPRWGRRTRCRYRAPAMPRTGVTCCSRCSAPRACATSSATPARPSCRSSTRWPTPTTSTTCWPCRRRPPSAWPTATPRPPAGPRSSTCTPRPAWATPSATSPTPRPTGTPLVVTAGQQDYRHIVTDPLLSGDLVGLARTGVEVGARGAHRSTSSARSCAGRSTTRPPRRPGRCSCRCRWTCSTRTGDGGRAGAATIDASATVRRRLEELADLLTEPRRGKLAIVAGDEVAPCGAVAALVALAEALGAPVHGARCTPRRCSRRAPALGRACSPPPRPPSPRRSPATTGCCSSAARRSWCTRTPRRRRPCPRSSCCTSRPTRPRSAAPARSASASPAILGPRSRRCSPLVAARADAAAAAAARRGRAGTPRAGPRAARAGGAAALRRRADRPMAAAHALLRAMPPRTPVVDEAITTGVYVRGFHHWTGPGATSSARAAGSAGACRRRCGVSLGLGGEPVLCVVGDGSAMYSPPGAVDRGPRAPAGRVRGGEQPPVPHPQELPAGDGRAARHATAASWAWTSIDPPVDFVGLARSMGVAATLVEQADDVGDAVRPRSTPGGPHLLELPIAARHEPRRGAAAAGRAARARRPGDPRRRRLGGPRRASAGSCSAERLAARPR